MPLLLMVLGVAAILDPQLARTDWIDPWLAIIGLLVVATTGIGIMQGGRRRIPCLFAALIGLALLGSAFIPPAHAGDANEFLASTISVLGAGLCFIIGLVILAVDGKAGQGAGRN